MTEIRRILQTPEVVTQVSAALKTKTADISEADALGALHEFDTLWARLFPAEQARIVQLLVRRITVTAAGLEVDIRREGIAGVIRSSSSPRSGAGVRSERSWRYRSQHHPHPLPTPTGPYAQGRRGPLI